MYVELAVGDHRNVVVGILTILFTINLVAEFHTTLFQELTETKIEAFPPLLPCGPQLSALAMPKEGETAHAHEKPELEEKKETNNAVFPSSVTVGSAPIPLPSPVLV